MTWKPPQDELVQSGGWVPPQDELIPSQPQNKSMLSKIWDGLAVPEQMSRQGLNMLASAVPGREPTGNMALDIGLNIPKVAAETLAEGAPGFISRGSILTAGALMGAKLAAPLIKTVGSGVAKGAEAISGLEYKTPGVLTAAAKDSSLMLGPGRASANELFANAVDPSKIRPAIAQGLEHKDIIVEGMKALADGSITPEEALTVRQSLDAAKKGMPMGTFIKLREAFDQVAKTISSQADTAFSRAIQSEALRQPLAVNKLGGTSIGKHFLGTMAGVLPSVAMMPWVQGGVATGLGMAARAGAPLANNAVQAGAMGAAGGQSLLDLYNRLRGQGATPTP